MATALKNVARGSAAKDIPVALAKVKVLDYIRQGWKVQKSMAAVERTVETYRDWMKSDPRFNEQVTLLRQVAVAARKRGVEGATVVPDFPEFSATYLGTPLPELHLRMWDAMCGGEPRSLHPSMRFQKGRPNFVLANFPPEFGKSTTWNMNYATWRIVKDPNVRIIIVSKSLPMAKKFLGGIKQRLTGHMFRDLQLAFAPEGGWKGTEGSWTTTEIYVEGRGSGEKDPTVQALGMGGQIYGARADVVICDDVVDLSNAAQWAPQMAWLGQEAITRLTPDGHMIVLGTRVQPIDLYAKLREQLDWDDEHPIWTYLAQPAVLESADHPRDWVSLWPEKWPGVQLARRKASLGAASRWALVFQQQDVLDNAVFPPHAVAASIDGMRSAGPLDACGPHSRPMRGLYVVAGLDPATVGYTAIIVAALDRQSKKRYVMDGFNQANCTPLLMKETIKRLTLTHRVQEWVIERNAFQRFLTQDDELRGWLNAHGAILREHYCVDSATEVLSDRGWRQSHALALGDRILTMNTTTGLSEWKPVDDIYRGDYSGPMIRFTGKVDALCTPDHKWVAERKYQALRKVNGLRLVAAQDLNTSYQIHIAAPSDDVTGPSFKDDIVEMVGWAVTEGHFRKVGTSIQIGQSPSANPDNCNQIRATLTRLGAQWSERDNGSGTLVFSVTGDLAREIRDITGGKNLPVEFVAALTVAQRSLLMDVLVAADGWTSRTGQQFLCSDSPSIIEGFEALSALMGLPTYMRYRADDPEHATVSRYPHTTLDLANNRPTVVPHWEGEVWCPQTTNGTFYARRGGRTYFTGNTHGQNKFDEDYGVAAMAPLFESCWEDSESGPERRIDGGLIDLPNPTMAGFCTDLVNQLVTWQPQARKRQLTDMVMALWFTEIAFRRILDNSSSMPDHLPNRFANRGGMRGRQVIDLLALETAIADEDNLVMTA